VRSEGLVAGAVPAVLESAVLESAVLESTMLESAVLESAVRASERGADCAGAVTAARTSSLQPHFGRHSVFGRNIGTARRL
jgi:hypothetical protein